MFNKLLIILIFLLAAIGAFADTGDIPLSSNFQLSSGRPLDARIRASNAAARNAIPGVQRYDGLLVYQIDTKHTFQLQGDTSTWVDVTSGSGTVTTLQATGVGFGGTANEVTQDTNTFTWDNSSKTLGVTGTIIINNAGSYGGGFEAAEGTQPSSGTVGAQYVWADSTTHTLHVIPNNGVDYVFIHSSITTPTTHGLPIWLGHGKIGDMGPAPWVVVPSTFPWTINYLITITSGVEVTGASTTIHGAARHVEWSTHTVSNAFEDVSQSSMAVGFIKAGDSYGTAGQFFASGGFSSSTTWKNPGCIPLSRTAIQAITPVALGECYYCTDCTTAVNCISSGTASSNQFISSASRAAGCL